MCQKQTSKQTTGSECPWLVVATPRAVSSCNGLLIVLVLLVASYSECNKGRRCVDVATGRVAQIKSLWPGHGVTSQYFEFEAGTAAAPGCLLAPAFFLLLVSIE